jgi:hypothetical protein
MSMKGISVENRITYAMITLAGVVSFITLTIAFSGRDSSQDTAPYLRVSDFKDRVTAIAFSPGEIPLQSPILQKEN